MKSFTRISSFFAALALQTLLLTSSVSALTFDEKFEHWPVDLKINGRIIVDHGLQDFSRVSGLFDQIASKKKVTCFVDNNKANNKVVDGLAEILKSKVGDAGEFEVVVADQFPGEQLKAALDSADVVVVQASETFFNSPEGLQQLKPDFQRFLRNRGTLIVNQATARLLGEYFQTQVAADRPSQVFDGLNLLPDCVLFSKSDDSGEARRKLVSLLALHPRCVGIELEDKTMLMLSGRKMSCYGSGTATFLLMANDRTPLRVESLVARRGRRQSAQQSLLDLTEWRRDAIDRTLARFPSAEPESPLVENGTLVIVGGGGMPRGLMSRFIELAGGKDHAKLVYIPCSEQDNVGGAQRTVESWKRAGVKNATFLHTKDRNQSNSDEDFLAPLKNATGVWFGGGRQWNLADSYYGTKAHRLMKSVLQRGGVMGGSSAGASIQGRYLARATPIGNFRIMAPGYERGGLGFISGVAIDQHFSQRGRHKDMTLLVNRYPQLLGIGLDEATAIIVTKSKAEVTGRGRVHFYDRNLPVYPDKPDYVALPAGSSYDLVERKVLFDATKVPDHSKE